MRLVEFPYTLYKGLQVPIIPLQLQNGGKWFELWAFVDSGATFLFLPRAKQPAWDWT